MNVALYGGSFDPPHIGHVMVPSHLLLNDQSIERVVVMPCFLQSGKNLTPFEHRLAMCREAFGWLPRLEVSSLEAELGGESITARTVRELIRRNPSWSLRFVIGSDLMARAPEWEGWDELIQLAYPLVVGRAGISPVGAGGPSPISPAVSSTVVREALGRAAYGEAERYIPRGVLSYIRENSLYAAPGVSNGGR